MTNRKQITNKGSHDRTILNKKEAEKYRAKSLNESSGSRLRKRAIKNPQTKGLVDNPEVMNMVA